MTAKACYNKKESYISIVAIYALSNIVTLASFIRTKSKNKDVLLSEISSIILSISGYYLGLPKVKII